MVDFLGNKKKINKVTIKGNTLEKIKYFQSYPNTFFDTKLEGYVLFKKNLPKKYFQGRIKGYDFARFPSTVWQEIKHYLNPETKRELIAYLLTKKDIIKIRFFDQKAYKKLPKWLNEKHINSILNRTNFRGNSIEYYIIKTALSNIAWNFTNDFDDLGKILFTINQILNLATLLEIHFNSNVKVDSYWIESKKNDFDFVSFIKSFKGWVPDTGRNNAQLKNLKELRDFFTHSLSYKKNEKSTTVMMCNAFFVTDDYLFLEVLIKLKSKEVKRKISRISIKSLVNEIENFIKCLISERDQWQIKN